MLARIAKAASGYTATFERLMLHAPQEVWAYLTDNDKLKEWFPELRVRKLGEGGLIAFDLGDGSFEKMRITAYEEGVLLEYEWGEDRVRFELYGPSATDEESRLVLTEKIGTVTDHTPRDLAGWHVCLDVIAALLGGNDVQDRMPVWDKLYPQYAEALKTAALQ